MTEEEDLKKRLTVANGEIQRLQQENSMLKNRNLALETIGKQWETDKMVQANIIQQTLTQKDVLLQQQGEEINRLRDEIKRLKNADINRLGD